MKKLIIFIMMINIVSLYAFNIEVIPHGFILPIDKGINKEITLINRSLEDTRVEISIGKPEGYKEKDTLDKYIRIYPKILNMKGDSSKTIRFSVRVPRNLPDGEYKSYIYFKEIPKNPSMIRSENNGIAVNMAMYSRLAIPVYGQKGELIYKGKIKNIFIKNKKLNIIIDSFGNKTIKPAYDLTYISGKNVLGFEKGIFGRTLKDGENALERKLEKVPKGTEKVLVKIYNDNNVLMGEKTLYLK
ncbi:MAG: fimbria/pilus periplasmic chaperone [Cetobacterium sp.]|nr:fimbria/pilus periplasmic chaperone [Cetobacterium sp.]